MPGTYIHFTEGQREAKQKSGYSWEQIMELGLKQAQADTAQAEQQERDEQ